jgi:hypothetical protein
MVLQILLCRINLGSSHGYREDVCSRNICPDCYVLKNGDSYPWLSNNVNQIVRLLFSDILVLVLLLMLIDYFKGCVHAHSLGITDYGRTFVGIFRSMVLYVSSAAVREVQDCIMKEKKSLKTTKIC